MPGALFECLRSADCVRIDAPLAARVDHLLARYTDLIADPADFCSKLDRLVPQHGHEQVAAWKALVEAKAWPQLAAELVTRHYDPAYRRGGEGLYRRLAEGQTLAVPSLDAATLAEVARGLAGR